MKVVWTIAGFDPSSGAGVTADLMTFAAHGLFGCAGITAYTVQSTMGVAGIEPVSPTLLQSTLEHLLVDLPPAGVKIGMLATAELAGVVGAFIRRLRETADQGPAIPVVLDPVLRSSSGRELYPASALDVLHEGLLPFVDWATPNWVELAALVGMTVPEAQQGGRGIEAALARHPNLNLVVTGGEQPVPTESVATRAGETFQIPGEHVETRATHGTGCAFSSALLCALVKGRGAEQAVQDAKAYVTGALRRAPGVGHGKGPMALLWPLAGNLSSDE